MNLLIKQVVETINSIEKVGEFPEEFIVGRAGLIKMKNSFLIWDIDNSIKMKLWNYYTIPIIVDPSLKENTITIKTSKNNFFLIVEEGQPNIQEKKVIPPVQKLLYRRITLGEEL
jgi:hypothetical protein